MGEWKNGIKSLVIFFLLHQVKSVLIVPAPTVAVESATSTSITINWTMPIDELYNYFEVEVHTPGVASRSFAINQTRYTFNDLTPGYLYTFLVTAVRGELRSNSSTVLQDTVPLPPTNLRLEAFSSLILSMEGVFGMVHFTLREPGIQAEWDGPDRGACDCYDVRLEPNDGRVARPAVNEREKGLTTIRQFIQLVPGQTYNITVRSTTCGHGFLGALTSGAINASITLPPSDPPPVTPTRVTNTSTYLSWEKEEIISGFYDNFEVIPLTNTHNGIVIHSSIDPRTRGRNVTGLMPCSTYNFEVFTINEGQRSENSERTEVLTRPSPVSNLRITNFNETFISIMWQHLNPNETAVFRVLIENFRTLFRPPSSTSETFGGLRPGTLHNVSVAAQCQGPSGVQSVPVQISQITVPLPPENIFVSCLFIAPDDSVFKPVASSLISILWTPPEAGSWDGFVIDFSPFAFENFTADPAPPVTVPGNTFEINITVPTTQKIFSVFVRSVRQNHLSSARFTEIACRNSKGNAIRQCRVRPATFKITIEIFNRTHFYVEVTGLRLKNITVDLSDVSDDVFVTTATRFFVINPCNAAAQKNLIDIVFYPLCTQDPSCVPIRRKLCAVVLRDENEELSLGLRKANNACCNGKAFNNNDQKCCHSKLTSVFDHNSQCCYTRWFDRTRQKCCGMNQGGGIIRPISRTCP